MNSMMNGGKNSVNESVNPIMPVCMNSVNE